MNAFPLFIARRFLFSQKKEKAVSVIGLFSLLGVALGVGALIVVMAVMNGFRAEITGKILGVNGDVRVTPKIGGYFLYDPAVRARLEALPSVRSAVPAVEGQAMILEGDVARGVAIKAVAPKDLSSLPLLGADMFDQERRAFAKPWSVLLGARLAAALGARTGDAVTFISSRVQRTAVGTLPRMKNFVVAGTFETGMYDYDANMAAMRLEDAQKFFGYADSVTEIEVRALSPETATATKNQINDLLSDEPLEASDWTDANSGLFNALKVERSVMFLILSLIVCVAAFNIVSGLMILVRDKYYDVAVLKTFGATRGQILAIFFLCGAFIGVVGTGLGVALGVAFALNIESIRLFLESLTGVALFDPVIYFLSELPAKLMAGDVIAAVSVGLGCSFLATFYPAWRASGRRPAEILRNE
ncbi:MAG: lipoprotein-releasing ABC transporter permease subunit [Rickettsiales bacterium]